MSSPENPINHNQISPKKSFLGKTRDIIDRYIAWTNKLNRVDKDGIAIPNDNSELDNDNYKYF
jgi:hypothetical protein